MKQKILSYLNKFKYYLIFGVILLASLIGNVCLIKSCSNQKDMNNNNIIALTDSIEYYKTKSGELVASKTLLEGDLTTLKLANDSLYKSIKSMKVSNPTSVVYVNSTVDNGAKDTLWSIVKDTVKDNLSITKDFAFNNKYRSLEGYVAVTDTTIGLNIQKDQVYFDFTAAVEDSKVIIKSNNPYIKYNEITGITIPSPKKKKWSLGIGPNIGYGYDFQHKKLAPYVGVGVNVQYNLLSW